MYWHSSWWARATKANLAYFSN